MDSQGDEDEDNEIDEWEKQQILKAIRKDTVGYSDSNFQK